MTTVRERIFQVFRAHDISVIFGNPGSTELPMIQEFLGDFSYILGLQEASVVAMAVGYYFETGNACVVNLHTAAGVGNAMGAIVTAWHAQAPVIITAGQQDRRQLFADPFLSGRQVDFVKPYVKWSIEPHRSVDVPLAIERAYHEAMSEPQGPVFVSIPMDGLEDDCFEVEPRKVSYKIAPDPEAIKEIASAISNAKKIALIAGEQVDAAGAMSNLVSLAELLQSSVYLPPIAYRWSFPSKHRLFRGHLPAAMGPIAEVLSSYDLVLVFGTSVFLYYPYVPGPIVKEGTRVIQITNDPSMVSRGATGRGIVGDVSLALGQLLPLVKQRDSQGSYPPPQPPREKTRTVPPTSEYVEHLLGEAIPQNAIVFHEAPTSERFARFDIQLPRSHFVTASGGLGFAMPGAVGASLAQTERPVIAIVGDGSAHYSIQSIWSSANYKAPVTFIVLNNEEYAILKSFGMMLHEEGIPGLDVPGIDFEGLAKGYGARYEKILDPDQIVPVVSRAIKSGKTNLIEIPIDRHVTQLL